MGSIQLWQSFSLHKFSAFAVTQQTFNMSKEIVLKLTHMLEDVRLLGVKLLPVQLINIILTLLITARKANSRRPGSPKFHTPFHHRHLEQDLGILPSKADDKLHLSTHLYFYKCMKRNFIVNWILDGFDSIIIL